MFPEPGDNFLQGFTGSAGPEDELVAGSFLIDQIFDQWSVRFAELRPITVAKGSVKVANVKQNLTKSDQCPEPEAHG